jgi:hypothetical protein
MKEHHMPNKMQPFANESDVIRIGELEIENRLDRVSITGDLVITKDQTGLALAQELQLLIGRVVKALEAEQQLPQTVELKPVETVKNPFA